MKFLVPVVSLVLSPILAIQPLLASTTAPASTRSEDASQGPQLQVSASAADGVVSPGTHSTKGVVIHVSDEAGLPVPDAAVLVRLPDSGATGVFSDATHANVAYTDTQGNVQFTGIQWSSETGAVPVIITVTKGAAHAGTILEQRLEVAQEKTVPPPATERATTPIPAPPVPLQPVAEHQDAPEQPGTLKVAPAVDSHTAAPPAASSFLHPASAAPSVSVVNAPTHQRFDSGTSHKKWILIAVVVAAGAGAAFALGSKKSSSSASSSAGSTTIGQPTVTVGAP